MSSKGGFAHNSKSLRMAAAGAVMALALGGCDTTAAQHTARVRPVLVNNVHYEAQARDRTFVGTIRPRTESELGFRVAGKVSKRLIEVGAMVDTGQPLATLDEVDLKLPSAWRGWPRKRSWLRSRKRSWPAPSQVRRKFRSGPSRTSSISPSSGSS